jgi:hypothetical protein
MSRKATVAFVYFITLALVACFVAFSSSASATQVDSSAFVRVVHASPDAGTVDVFVDGNKLLSDFKFGTVTGYVNVPAGAHNIQVAPAGQGAGAAVITQTVSVSAGVPYTVAAVGTKSSGFSLVAFGDNNLLSGSMAKVRVYHLSPDAGPVNVAAGGKTAISGLTYQNASDYLSLAPGSYTFHVTATQAGATVPVSATLKGGGTVNSVFAVGLLKGSPQLQFVLASVSGVPGMPGTGSDPHAAPASSPALPWGLGIAVVVLLSSGVVVRRLVLARQGRK